MYLVFLGSNDEDIYIYIVKLQRRVVPNYPMIYLFIYFFGFQPQKWKPRRLVERNVVLLGL